MEKQSVEGTTSSVLTAIRQHSSLSEQNQIVRTIVHEIGISRLNLVQALEHDLSFARKDAEEFFVIQPKEVIDKFNNGSR